MKLALSALTLSSLSLVAVTGCAGSSIPLPENARVESMQTDKMIVRGEAAASVENPSCQTKALPAKHFVKLNDDVAGHFLLRPAAGDPALRMAVLHVTNVDTGKTWCVQGGADGTPATISAEFPQGTYAISVTEGRTTAPHRYEVVIEKI